MSHRCSFADFGGPASLCDDVKNVGGSGGGAGGRGVVARSIAACSRCSQSAHRSISCALLYQLLTTMNKYDFVCAVIEDISRKFGDFDTGCYSNDDILSPCAV